jgi:uracil-DNA glycosylase family 4
LYRRCLQTDEEKLVELQSEITACNLCARLRDHCVSIAAVKRRAYLDWEYWGKPVPSFGDREGRLLIVGLAPGAHGANRTGRVFTGDKSGDFLFEVLHETGFASQPLSQAADDGLFLSDAYIATSVRCAPPDNKPERAEWARCRPFLERELDLLPKVEVVVALGRLAFENYLKIMRDRGVIQTFVPFTFGHNKAYRLAEGAPLLLASYHPSQQNTSTGKLTKPMLMDVFAHARTLFQ